LQLGQFFALVEMKKAQLQQTKDALQLGHCFALGKTKRRQLQQNAKQV